MIDWLKMEQEIRTQLSKASTTDPKILLFNIDTIVGDHTGRGYCSDLWDSKEYCAVVDKALATGDLLDPPAYR